MSTSEQDDDCSCVLTRPLRSSYLIGAVNFLGFKTSAAQSLVARPSERKRIREMGRGEREREN